VTKQNLRKPDYDFENTRKILKNSMNDGGHEKTWRLNNEEGDWWWSADEGRNTGDVREADDQAKRDWGKTWQN